MTRNSVGRPFRVSLLEARVNLLTVPDCCDRRLFPYVSGLHNWRRGIERSRGNLAVQQTMPDGKVHERGIALQAERLHCTVFVKCDGSRRDPETSRNGLHGKAGNQELEDFQFPVR